MNFIKTINLSYIKLSGIVKMGNKNSLTSVDPETKHCHSEPFDKIHEESLIYQIVIRFFFVPP